MQFWPCVAGVVVLGVGLAAAWREFSAARGLEKLVTLGRAFAGASLAAFGAEHLSGAQFIAPGVPAYMPMREFWVYFVGIALIAAGISLALNRFVRWSALLTGCMELLFVLMIHVPNAAAHPDDRIIWTVVLRDLGFAAGMWALAGSRLRAGLGARALVLAGRVLLGIVVIFFAVEHFLHPLFAPGVPLSKVTPAWVPVAAVWGYLTGLLLLAGGVLLLVNWRARIAAAGLGLVMTVLAVLLYLPIQVMVAGTPVGVEGLNYTFDTLLFAGTLLVLAGALPKPAGLILA
jgi:uncharacterized membrane protein